MQRERDKNENVVAGGEGKKNMFRRERRKRRAVDPEIKKERGGNESAVLGEEEGKEKMGL